MSIKFKPNRQHLAMKYARKFISVSRAQLLEGKNYQKNIDLHDFQDDSNFPGLFSNLFETWNLTFDLGLNIFIRDREIDVIIFSLFNVYRIAYKMS